MICLDRLAERKLLNILSLWAEMRRERRSGFLAFRSACFSAAGVPISDWVRTRAANATTNACDIEATAGMIFPCFVMSSDDFRRDDCASKAWPPLDRGLHPSDCA